MVEMYIDLKRNDSEIGNIKIVFPSNLKDINALIGSHKWSVVGTNIDNVELGATFDENLYNACQKEIKKIENEFEDALEEFFNDLEMFDDEEFEEIFDGLSEMFDEEDEAVCEEESLSFQ